MHMNVANTNLNNPQQHAKQKTALHTAKVLFSSIVTGFLLSWTSANAEEMNCKGIAQDTCEMEALCTWVDSYERKDGKKINGYCRKAYVSKTKANTNASTKVAATEATP